MCPKSKIIYQKINNWKFIPHFNKNPFAYYSNLQRIFFKFIKINILSFFKFSIVFHKIDLNKYHVTKF